VAHSQVCILSHFSKLTFHNRANDEREDADYGDGGNSGDVGKGNMFLYLIKHRIMNIYWEVEVITALEEGWSSSFSGRFNPRGGEPPTSTVRETGWPPAPFQELWIRKIS
jgi:hypothetical protein